MTKKHYEMIAARIADKVTQAQVLEDYHQKVEERATASRWRRAEWSIVELAENLANDLKADNPNFDIDKFRQACKIGGGVTTEHTCHGVA